MILPGELPLRVIDHPKGATVACLCGAECASVDRRAAHQMTRLRAAPSITGLSPDVTPAGLLRMIVHAKNCQRGKNLLLEQRGVA